ncbi:MAG: hypothetical protein U0Z44_09675 [Kouleothrix sp.]
MVLIGRRPDDQLAAQPAPFPALIPPGVVLVQACAPGEPLPPAQARLRAADYAPTHAQLAVAAEALGCVPAPAVQRSPTRPSARCCMRSAGGRAASQRRATPAAATRGCSRCTRAGGAGSTGPGAGWRHYLRLPASRSSRCYWPASPASQPPSWPAGYSAGKLLIEATDRRVALYHPATRRSTRDQSSDWRARMPCMSSMPAPGSGVSSNS